MTRPKLDNLSFFYGKWGSNALLLIRNLYNYNWIIYIFVKKPHKLDITGNQIKFNLHLQEELHLQFFLYI